MGDVLSTSDSGGGGKTAVPAKIDRYEIRRRIGWGGQGAVFLAYDPHLDLEVALKVLHADVGSGDFVERFKVEAQTMVRLNHPNVVRVYDYNPSYPYIVMEYCDGGDLADILKRRERLPLVRIVSILDQILAGMEVAHTRESAILHRDLKPGNVLFAGGHAKVADFGLAKVLGADTSLTQTRSLMGSIRYTSPEQCADPSRVDHRTDLWAAGVLLYELLTWERPFDLPGDNFVTIALRIGSEAPRAPKTTIPTPLAGVIDRALAKEREERYVDATAMRAALSRAVDQLGDDQGALYPPEDVLGEGDHLAAKAAKLLDNGRVGEAERCVEKLESVSSADRTLAKHWRKALERARAGQAAGEESASAPPSVVPGHGTRVVPEKTVASDVKTVAVTPPTAAPGEPKRPAAASAPAKKRRGAAAWIVPAIVAAALIVGGVAAPYALRAVTPEEPALHTLTLTSLGGSRQLLTATRDGASVPELLGEVGETPRSLALPAGTYVLDWGAGEPLAFSLESDRVVVLGPRADLVEDAWLEVLQPTLEVAP